MSGEASQGVQPVETFDDFYTEVKEIEKRDAVLTPKQQIERLLRPGSTYFNLNPFEVLQCDVNTTVDEIKKKYRRYSILVHPDKNPDDSERAQKAFEIINRAWKTLENDETRKKCLDVYEEAKDRTQHMIEEKRKKQKKEGRLSEGVPEDDPDKFKHAVYVMTMKLFADMERKRQHLEVRDMEERKRKREAEIDQEEKQSLEKEWAKNFELLRSAKNPENTSPTVKLLTSCKNLVKPVWIAGKHFNLVVRRKRRKRK